VKNARIIFLKKSGAHEGKASARKKSPRILLKAKSGAFFPCHRPCKRHKAFSLKAKKPYATRPVLALVPDSVSLRATLSGTRALGSSARIFRYFRARVTKLLAVRFANRSVIFPNFRALPPSVPFVACYPSDLARRALRGTPFSLANLLVSLPCPGRSYLTRLNASYP